MSAKGLSWGGCSLLQSSSISITKTHQKPGTIDKNLFSTVVIAQKKARKFKKIILTEDVPEYGKAGKPLGKKGQLLEVKPGFFRNYLYPFGKAQPVTALLLKEMQMEEERIGAEKRRECKRFLHAAQGGTRGENLQLEFLCNYLAELSLLDYGCVQFLPSEVAASVVFLSRFTINPKMHPWSISLQHHTGYAPAQLEKCIHAIHELQTSKRASNVMAIREKYKVNKIDGCFGVGCRLAKCVLFV